MAYSSFITTDGMILMVKVKDKRMPSFSLRLLWCVLKLLSSVGTSRGHLLASEN